MPFRSLALGGSLPSWLRVGCLGQCTQGFFRQNQHSLQKRRRLELVQAAETTRQAAVPTEPEAAQILLGPMGSRGLGEN